MLEDNRYTKEERNLRDRIRIDLKHGYEIEEHLQETVDEIETDIADLTLIIRNLRDWLDDLHESDLLLRDLVCDQLEDEIAHFRRVKHVVQDRKDLYTEEVNDIG